MTVSTGRRCGVQAGSMAVVIVNYSTCRELRACLGSIKPDAVNQVVVVDNNSSDDSVEMVKAEYPWVTLHANNTNPGYGAAANQAVAGCSTEYVLLLNSDTLLQAGAPAALSRYLDQHPRAAIVGPRLVNGDGTVQASCYPFPAPLDTFLENSTWAVSLGRLIRRYVPGIRGLYWRTWQHDSTRIVPWIKGAAMAIRRKAFDEVSGFEESFFMYFEDADLCYRLAKAGWEVHFAPVTTIVHAGGASTDRVRAEMAAQLLQSTALFYERHNCRANVVLMQIIVKSLMLAKWVGSKGCLTFTRDVEKCEVLSDRIAACKKVLFAKSQYR